MSVQTTDRVQRLARALSDNGIDAYFATTAISMGYLQGFHESAHERFLTMAVRSSGEVRMICPALSESQARRAGLLDVRSWRDAEDPIVLFNDLAEAWSLRTGILAVDDEMQAQMLLRMQDALPAALFKPGQEVLSTLMRTKDEEELANLRHSAEIADKALPAAIAAVKSGVTETEICRVISDEMRALGGTPTFCIVAAGPFTAEPHHNSGETKIKAGDVLLMDFGCSYGGYQSDITRTITCGPATEEMRKIYDVVFQAHQAARSGIKPGVACWEIDALARQVIEDAGYGEFFVHRTGHGIGLKGHEEPYIVSGNDFRLEEGNCFSIEPGIYVPGRFGVRVENIVCVTPGGYTSLNADPSPTLIEA